MSTWAQYNYRPSSWEAWAIRGSHGSCSQAGPFSRRYFSLKNWRGTLGSCCAGKKCDCQTGLPAAALRSNHGHLPSRINTPQLQSLAARRMGSVTGHTPEEYGAQWTMKNEWWEQAAGQETRPQHQENSRMMTTQFWEQTDRAEMRGKTRSLWDMNTDG